ncbi:MAG: hypothetical protein FJ347_05770 [Sphingomonadales bacterium]|nr:hypothetical protein [Sphingomonadales bacterium]
MQKINRFCVAAVLISIVFTACKYEDGPGISLRAKRDRIANEWIVGEFIYDGKNVTDSVNSRQDTFSIIFEMTRTGSYSVEWVRYTVDPNNGMKYYGTSHATNHNLNNSGPAMWNPQNIGNYGRKMPIPLKVLGARGFWSFDEKHKKISIGPESSYNAEPSNGNRYHENARFWNITKLKEKNIAFKGVDSTGKSWSMQLKNLNREPYWY